MAGQPKQTKVKLTADLDAKGEVVFATKSGEWDGKKFTFSKKALGMSADDYHVIQFELEKDSTKLGLRFPALPTDAMWVMKHDPANPKCPGMNDVCDYSVMGPMVRVDDHTLLAYNLNRVVEQLCFTLNFVKQGESGTNKAAYVAYDPITDNKDFTGPLSESFGGNTAAMVAAAGTVLVSGLALLGLRRSRLDQRRK